MTSRGNECRAGQRSVRVETNRLAFFEKIIIRISIDQRCDVANDESFLAVGDVNKGIEEIDRLLFVFRKMLTCWIERESARQREAGCVFGGNAGALAKRRNRRADDTFCKSFLIDVRDVEYFDTVGPIRW